MEYVQTRDILKKATDFHNRLSAYYEEEKDRLDGAKVKLVLHYLSRHERNLAELLKRCAEDTKLSIVNTWFKYTPDSLSALMGKEVHIPEGSDTEDIIRIALDMDDHLIAFYDDAAARAMSEEVREFFENLRDQEIQEEHILSRGTLSEL